MNIYINELIEMINHSEVRPREKQNLTYAVQTCESHVQLSRALLRVALNALSYNDILQEKLAYAEANRTHPKDVLVVGDGKIVYVDKEPKGEIRCEDIL